MICQPDLGMAISPPALESGEMDDGERPDGRWSGLSERLDPQVSQNSQTPEVGSSHPAGSVFSFRTKAVAFALENPIDKLGAADDHAVREVADFVAQCLGDGHFSTGLLDFLDRFR